MDAATRKRMSSSAYEHWCTPPELTEVLERFGTVALDPCCHRASQVPALVRLYREGLGPLSWIEHAPQLQLGRHFAYVNSPYGRKLWPWITRVIEQVAQSVEVVQLVPARIDTGWFRLGRDHSSSWAGVRGRLRFCKPHARGRGLRKDRAPAFFPSALLYYGQRVDEFVDVFSSVADCYRYQPPSSESHHAAQETRLEHHRNGATQGTGEAPGDRGRTLRDGGRVRSLGR